MSIEVAIAAKAVKCRHNALFIKYLNSAKVTSVPEVLKGDVVPDTSTALKTRAAAVRTI
jgi:hypothetical protein